MLTRTVLTSSSPSRVTRHLADAGKLVICGTTDNGQCGSPKGNERGAEVTGTRFADPDYRLSEVVRTCVPVRSHPKSSLDSLTILFDHLEHAKRGAKVLCKFWHRNPIHKVRSALSCGLAVSLSPITGEQTDQNLCSNAHPGSVNHGPSSQ